MRLFRTSVWTSNVPTEAFVVFLSPCRKIQGQNLQLGHERFLPRNFQFIYRYRQIIRDNIV
jgi:hypothetical protein